MRIRYSAALFLVFQLAQALHAQDQAADRPKATEVAAAASTQPAPTSQPTSMQSLIPDLPDYSGDFWKRSYLTGDWGGARTELADKGFFFSLDLEQTIQGNPRGGRDTNGAFRYSGSADLRFRFDTARMQLWPGGLLELHAETQFGDFLNAKVGSLVNDDELYPFPGDPEFMLSHVTYTQALSEHLVVVAGKLDTTAADENEFAWVGSNNNFLHSSLRWNPIAAATTPYSTLGAGFMVFDDWFHWSFTVFDSEGVPSRSGFDTVFERGTVYATEARFAWDPFDLQGHQLFGFVYSDKQYLALDYDPRSGLDVPRGLPGRIRRLARNIEFESRSWAFLYNFDQYIYQEQEDPTQGVGVFGRFGISDGKANPVDSFYSIGLGGKGVLPGRDQDRFGIGYFYTEFSDGILLEEFGVNNTQGVELFYNIEIAPWLHITPDLQVIVDPGGVSDRDTAIVCGIRAQMSF